MTTDFSLYTKRFFSGTFLSRLSGMARDLTMAFFFGDHPSVAAFMVAFRFSNLFRRLFGEGPFQSAFIPYFEGIRLKDPQRSFLFFRKITLLFIFILVGIVISLELILQLSGMYGHISANNREIIVLMQWMLPGLIFICLYGLNISLLNCNDCFFIPSFAPFICNMIWILGVFFIKTQPTEIAMITLSKLVVFGFFGQWLLTFPLTLRYAPSKLKDWLNGSIPPEVKTLLASFSLGTIGVGAIQINAFVDSLFARHACLKGPIYLWYSIRLEQLAFAIFGIACVSTIIPRLSRAIKSEDKESAQNYFSLSFKRILSVMIPCTFAIFLLGGSSVALLYGRGQFSPFAVAQTTYCLWSYTLGLIPMTMVVLFSSVFYAHNNFKTPTVVSLITVGINLLLNILFVFGFGLGAISTTLATGRRSWANDVILQNLAQKKGWTPRYSFSRWAQLVVAGFAALCFSVVLFYTVFHSISFSFLSQPLLMQAIRFCSLMIFFMIGLGLWATFFKNQDLVELFQEFSPFRSRKKLKD